jgi:hypothetical protein
VGKVKEAQWVKVLSKKESRFFTPELFDDVSFNVDVEGVSVPMTLTVGLMEDVVKEFGLSKNDLHFNAESSKLLEGLSYLGKDYLRYCWEIHKRYKGNISFKDYCKTLSSKKNLDLKIIGNDESNGKSASYENERINVDPRKITVLLSNGSVGFSTNCLSGESLYFGKSITNGFLLGSGNVAMSNRSFEAWAGVKQNDLAEDRFLDIFSVFTIKMLRSKLELLTMLADRKYDQYLLSGQFGPDACIGNEKKDMDEWNRWEVSFFSDVSTLTVNREALFLEVAK